MFPMEYTNSENLPTDDGAGTECITNEAQWGVSRATEVSVTGVRADIFNPISSIVNSKVFQFDITCSLNEVLDPKTAKLFLTYKIVDENGDDIPLLNPPIGGNAPARNETSYVLPVNGMAYSLFKSCEIKLNGHTIAGGDMLYAHKANIQKRISVVEPVRKELGLLEGWDQEPIPWDQLSDTERNEIWELDAMPAQGSEERIRVGSLVRRYLDTRGSQQKQLISNICADIFTQNEFLPPNTKLTVVLTRQDNDKFCLISKNNHNYRIVIVNAYIECQVKCLDVEFVQNEILKMQRGQMYRSVFKNIEMTEYFHAQGLSDLSKPVLFNLNSVSPERFFAVLVRQSAMNGSHKRDPFYYTDFNMSHFAHVRNDAKTRHRRVFLRRWGDPNRKNDADVAEVVFNLYKAVNLSCHGDDVLGIDIYNILKGNFIMGFNLQKNDGATSGEIYDLPDNAKNGIEIKLREGLSEAVVNIIYAEYNREILIDSNGNVIVKDNALA